ncbi:uncharacterized protein [Anser cygnoides]|uniref:uncharacterized protein isoform X2 n=1 Tax=Anser cygnoides TaxID=8845 RepID=UPI0034D30F12
MRDPPGSQHLHLSRGDGGLRGAANAEVFLTVLWPCRCSRHGSECCGCKGFLLSHTGSLKSKSCLAVSKATTCGIIKKDEALVCQRYGILAWREHFIFICCEESNVSLPAKLRRRNGDRAVQVNQDNPKNSEGVCERPGRTSTGEVLLVPAASRLGLVPARSRGADFTSHLGSISDASPGNAGDTHYLHLTWKPKRNFMALESGMSAVCLVVLQPGVNRALLRPGSAGADLLRMLSVCQRKNTMLEGKPIYKCVPTERSLFILRQTN